MFIRSICTAAIGLSLALAPQCKAQEKRGPSTPEERQQILESIHAWQANPLGSDAKDQFGRVLKWFTEVPDLSVHVCVLLDKLPKGDKKDAGTIFGGQFMAQAAFVLENPDKRSDLLAEYQAGVEGALQTYEWLLKSNPKDKQAYLDDLLQRRTAGTLPDFVKERAVTACK